MIEDFARSQQPAHRVILRESLAFLAWSVFYPLGIKKSRKRTERRSSQRTTVFIHGYLSNPASFYPLSTYLRLMGKRQALFFRYSAKTGVESAAQELRKFLKTHVRGGRVDLVCHSLGGLIAQVYIHELGGARKVDRCITLGTPNQGTYSSYWMNTRTARDLRPDSPLMKRLAARGRRRGPTQFTAIVGGSDNIVVPRVFAAGAASDETVHVPDVGHIGLLFSPKVFFEVARRLEGEPTRATLQASSG